MAGAANTKASVTHLWKDIDEFHARYLMYNLIEPYIGEKAADKKHILHSCLFDPLGSNLPYPVHHIVLQPCCNVLFPAIIKPAFQLIVYVKAFLSHIPDSSAAPDKGKWSLD